MVVYEPCGTFRFCSLSHQLHHTHTHNATRTHTHTHHKKHQQGKLVEVQVKSGEVFEGYFHTATTERGYGVVLKFAHKKEASGETATSKRPTETFIIYPQDFVQLTAKEVTFEAHTTKGRAF